MGGLLQVVWECKIVSKKGKVEVVCILDKREVCVPRVCTISEVEVQDCI